MLAYGGRGYRDRYRDQIVTYDVGVSLLSKYSNGTSTLNPPLYVKKVLIKSANISGFTKKSSIHDIVYIANCCCSILLSPW